MKIKIKRRNRFDIANSGTLSDLAFLLIVFFIVIAVFNINQGFILQLPRLNSKKLVNTEDIIKVRLDGDGALMLDKRAIGTRELEDQITRKLADHPNMTFLLNIHPDVAYQKVVQIVELVKKLNVDNFSFSMQENDL
jgi:biopolymer transport protein ExbD